MPYEPGRTRPPGSHRPYVVFAVLALLLALGNRAIADRYVITVGDSTVVVEDPVAYSRALDPYQDADDPSIPPDLGLPPPPGARYDGPPTLTTDGTVTVSGLLVPQQQGERPDFSLDAFLTPVPPVDPAFAALMAANWNVTAAADLSACWCIYLCEPPPLSMTDPTLFRYKTGNVAVRRMLETGVPYVAAVITGRDPLANRCRSAYGPGAIVRTGPYGPLVTPDLVIPLGTVVDLERPACGPWYKLADGRGWICSFFVEPE